MKRQSKAVAFCLVLVTAVVYSGMLRNDFAYYDDEQYITSNVHIQRGLSWTGIKWAFSSIGYADNWHPLTWLSHMLDIQLFGLDPAGHHFTNLLLHILATLLLFGFLFSATGLLRPSTFVAALFALHPLHVESVAWAAERKDVLSAVFWFAALWAYAYYGRCPTIKRYFLVFILFALGLMAKPMLVTLPFIVLLLDYWPLQRLTADKRSLVRLAAEKVPLVLLTIASSIITIVAQQGALGSLQQYPLSTRVSSAAISYCVYLYQTFWPVKLSVFYSFWLPRPGITILCFLLLITITAVVIWFGRKKKYLLTGWLWYLAALVPVIGIMQVGSQAHADRYTYIPLTGIFIMAAWSLYEIAGRMTRLKKLLVHSVLAAVVVCMAVKTREQIGYWKNGLTLFSHVFDVTKGKVNENAYYNFGNLLSKAGRTDEAVSCYRKALEINRDHTLSHYNLGILSADMGRNEEAMAHYRRALELKPDNAEARNNLGALLEKTGRTGEAVVHYRKALETNPNCAQAYDNLGALLEKTGLTEEALTHYRKTLELNPGDTRIRNNLGTLLAKTGRTDEALAQFLKALEINPAYGDAHYNAGLLLADMGRTGEAVVHYRKALELRPDDGGAHFNLGSLLAKTGRTDEALAHYRKALELNPRNAGARNNLGALLAETGRIDEAIVHYRKAWEINPDDIGILENLVFTLAQKGRRTDADSVLEKALASSKSAGDEARAETIAQILEELHKDGNPSPASSKTNVPQRGAGRDLTR